MKFGEFKNRALTTLIGLQQENGSWHNDAATTISALDALSEECGGPDPVCRFSGLHAHLYPKTAPNDWLFKFSWGLNSQDDGNMAAYVAAIYHGIGFGWRELPQDEPIDPARAWLLSKWLRMNVLTDADFQLHVNIQSLEQLKAEEPWLIALIGQSSLHCNAYWARYSKNNPEERPDIISRVKQLLNLIRQDHWEGRTITPEEATAITGAFLFHDCTVHICGNAAEPLDLRSLREVVVHWLVSKQSALGSWNDSPHLTAHCLKFLDNVLVGLHAEYANWEGTESLSYGITYLLQPSVVAQWGSLYNYQDVDILATLIRLSKRHQLHSIVDSVEIDDSIYAPDVFISYGGPDAAFAKKLAKDFEANGIRVWFAEWDLDYGDDIVQSIENGLIATSKFVIVLSPEAVKRPWVRKELSSAFQQALSGSGKLILPVMYRQCQPPPFLASHRLADFTNEAQYELRISEIIRRLKGKKPSRT